MAPKPDNCFTLDTPYNRSIWGPGKGYSQEANKFITKYEMKALPCVHKLQTALDKIKGSDDRNPQTKPADCHVMPLSVGRRNNR